MTQATVMTAAAAPRLTRSRTPRGALVGLSIVGGGLMIGGAVLPWLTVYAGLDTFRGTDGLNGRILGAAGVASIAISLVYALRPAPRVRSLIGLLGFAASGFAAWVIAQLVGTYQQLGGDPFALPGLGLGAFVALAGGLCVLSTLLIPQTGSSDAGAALRGGGATTADASAALRTGVVAFLLAAAMIHLAVIGPHLSESVLYAVFFVGAGCVQVGAALLVTMRPSRALLVALVAGNVLLIALWAVTRISGLPIGPTPGIAESVSLPDVLASVSEAVVAGLAATLAWRRSWVPVRPALGRAVMAGTAVAAAAVAVFGVIGVQAGGG